MSTHFPFQIFFDDSSSPRSTRGLHKTRDQGEVRGLQAVLISPTQVKLVTSRKKPTNFYARLPPFLSELGGFYLGQNIQPQVLINGQYYYLRHISTITPVPATSGTSTSLVTTPGTVNTLGTNTPGTVNTLGTNTLGTNTLGTVNTLGTNSQVNIGTTPVIVNLGTVNPTSHCNSGGVYEISTQVSDGNFRFRLESSELRWNCPAPFTVESPSSSTSSCISSICSATPICVPECTTSSKSKDKCTKSGKGCTEQEVLFSNFTLANAKNPECRFNEVIFRSTNQCNPKQLVFPPSACNLSYDARICGSEGCPEDFTADSRGVCVNNDEGIQGVNGTNRISFGLRYRDDSGQETVITYRDEVVNGQTKVIFEYVDPSQLGLDSSSHLSRTESNLANPRERWFFADVYTKEFEVGKFYPIYVTFGSGLKLYLTPPRTTRAFTRNSQGIVESIYNTINTPTGRILSFRPSVTGKYNQYVFAPSDFPNLKVFNESDSTRFALWKGVALDGTNAVVLAGTSSPQVDLSTRPRVSTEAQDRLGSTQGTSQGKARDFAGNRRKSGTTQVQGDTDLISTDIIPGSSPRGLNSLTNPPASTGLNQPSSTYASSWALFVGIILVLILVFFLGFLFYQSHRLDPNASPDLEYSPNKTIASDNLTSYWVPLPSGYGSTTRGYGSTTCNYSPPSTPIQVVQQPVMQQPVIQQPVVQQPVVQQQVIQRQVVPQPRIQPRY